MPDLTDNELKVLIESNRVKQRVKKLETTVMSKDDKTAIIAELTKMDYRLSTMMQELIDLEKKEQQRDDEEDKLESERDANEVEVFKNGFAEIKTQQQNLKEVFLQLAVIKPKATYIFDMYYDRYGRIEKIIATPKMIN